MKKAKKEIRVDMVISLLTRHLVSKANPMKTSDIARRIGAPPQKAWTVLDRLDAEGRVGRSPEKKGGLKYLYHDATGKAFFPTRGVEYIVNKSVKELVNLAERSPGVLEILQCTLNDIKNLEVSDLETYNTWVEKLEDHGIEVKLSQLHWRTRAVRWWPLNQYKNTAGKT